jgi:hypothetical protein
MAAEACLGAMDRMATHTTTAPTVTTTAPRLHAAARFTTPVTADLVEVMKRPGRHRGGAIILPGKG